MLENQTAWRPRRASEKRTKDAPDRKSGRDGAWRKERAGKLGLHAGWVRSITTGKGEQRSSMIPGVWEDWNFERGEAVSGELSSSALLLPGECLKFLSVLCGLRSQTPREEVYDLAKNVSNLIIFRAFFGEGGGGRQISRSHRPTKRRPPTFKGYSKRKKTQK